MPLLNRLPNSVREPPGLEWRILRKLPVALLGTTVVPLLMVAFSVWFPAETTATLIDKHVLSTKILAVSLWLTAWTAIFTLAIGCVIVWVMKGPAYVADRYDLVDADEPAPGGDGDRQRPDRE